VLALLLVALSVGLDNLGASTGIGLSGVDGRLRLRIALVFGTFEAAMPVLGLLLGRSLATTLGSHAKLAAGLILVVVGLYAVAAEALAARCGRRTQAPPSLGTARLVVLGATLSIDNLAIGFALGSYHVNLLAAALIIAAVSVALALAGLELGARLGQRLGQRSELLGGSILIVIGVVIAAGLL
jgi:manganese efflux pump family protein